jgi:hypothetical protein
VIYTQDLDFTKTNLDVVKVLGFDLKVLQNQNFIKMSIEDLKLNERMKKLDLSISGIDVQKYSKNSLKVTLNFTKISDISLGGFENEDQLLISIKQTDVFKFSKTNLNG